MIRSLHPGLLHTLGRYMVFELLALGPVMDISSGRIETPEGRAARALGDGLSRTYFRQLLLAVEYLHHHGIV